jgi:RNA polymerase sigma-70 factor (ECF subfamily)
LEKQRSNQLEDSELIRLYLKTQRSEYFSPLYRRYSNKVYGKCLSLLKDEALAADAMQEVFTKVFLNLAKFQEKAKFSTWLYSITYNYCIDYIRKQKKAKSIFSDEMEKAPDIIEEVPDHYLMEMEVGRLKKVLDNIPVGDKEVLLMKYRDEHSIKEIAEILDKTESAIKMKIKRAKQKAQEKYKELFAHELV